MSMKTEFDKVLAEYHLAIDVENGLRFVANGQRRKVTEAKREANAARRALSLASRQRFALGKKLNQFAWNV